MVCVRTAKNVRCKTKIRETLTLRLQNTHICVFLDYFSLRQFLATSYFWLLLKIKTKLSKFWTRIPVKQEQFLPSKCSSLLQRSKPVQRHYSCTFGKSLKQSAPSKVNETKLNSETAL